MALVPAREAYPGGRPHHQSRRKHKYQLTTRCIRFSCAMSGATQMVAGDIECPLAHSLEATRVSVGSKLDGHVSHIHSAANPLQPEAHLLLLHTIFRKSIGSQIVPLFTHPVSSFAHRSRLPPAEGLS